MDGTMNKSKARAIALARSETNSLRLQIAAFGLLGLSALFLLLISP
jgi:hypothetical protein